MIAYRLIIVILCILITDIVATNSHGYADRAHRAINKAVMLTKLTSAPLQDYFKLNLGYSNERETVNGTRIIEWFENAGALEDRPPWRTPNHFLDPLKNKGFSGFLFGTLASGLPVSFPVK